MAPGTHAQLSALSDCQHESNALTVKLTEPQRLILKMMFRIATSAVSEAIN
jgi:hypothetical protein